MDGNANEPRVLPIHSLANASFCCSVCGKNFDVPQDCLTEVEYFEDQEDLYCLIQQIFCIPCAQGLGIIGAELYEKMKPDIPLTATSGPHMLRLEKGDRINLRAVETNDSTPS